MLIMSVNDQIDEIEIRMTKEKGSLISPKNINDISVGQP